MAHVTFFFFLISCIFPGMSIKLNRNGDLMNSVFMRVNETSVKDSTNVGIVLTDKLTCGSLNGNKAMQCLTLKVSNEFVSTTSLAAEKIKKVAFDVSTKIKRVSEDNAKFVKKFDFSFAVSFLQVYDELVLLVKSCSKLQGVPRLRCLINLGAKDLQSTGDTAAQRIDTAAKDTHKDVSKLNEALKKISGFERLSKKFEKADEDMKKKANSISKKIKDAGKKIANAVKQAGGIRTSFLEVVVQENVMECQNLNGVKLMNCISTNAGKKMEDIGASVARNFQNEAYNIANKIATLGNDVAGHIRKEFSKLNKERLLKKAVVPPNEAFLKSLIECNQKVGIPKIECIVKRGVKYVHKSGKINSKSIEKVGTDSKSYINQLTEKMKKMSGFEPSATNVDRLAVAMQKKSKKLADVILESCRVIEADVKQLSGLKEMKV